MKIQKWGIFDELIPGRPLIMIFPKNCLINSNLIKMLVQKQL